jgi:hypothetical protein
MGGRCRSFWYRNTETKIDLVGPVFIDLRAKVLLLTALAVKSCTRRQWHCDVRRLSIVVSWADANVWSLTSDDNFESEAHPRLRRTISASTRPVQLEWRVLINGCEFGTEVD